MWTSKDHCDLKKIRYPKLRNLALFYVWEDARVWAHWNQSFGMQPSYLGPVSRVSTSWVSSGLTTGNGCSLMAARGQVFLPSWVSWGVTSSPSVVAGISGDCNIFVIPSLYDRKYSISYLFTLRFFYKRCLSVNCKVEKLRWRMFTLQILDSGDLLFRSPHMQMGKLKLREIKRFEFRLHIWLSFEKQVSFSAKFLV